MRSKSSTVSESSSTRMGKRPCSSGIRSEGLDRWKAPLAMNSMWSVFTMPYLVETVVPSTSGSRSRCTPWRETSAPIVSPRLAILSISSRNTMPFCSTLASALARKSSSLTRRAASSSVSIPIASRTFMRRSFLLPPPRFWNMPWICCVSSSIPGGANISMCAWGADTSISTSLSSSSPSRSFLRNFWRVADSSSPAAFPAGSASRSPKGTAWRAGGSNTSSTRSSAESSALRRTFFIADSRVSLIAVSTRSRTMVSTSRPTYPTSVNFVASTLMKGASARRARRRAISVLPTPVGPIMRMFFGVISCRSGSPTCCRRQRFLSAMATARLARSWPTMCLSSSWTISCGVMEDIEADFPALFQRFDDDLLIGVDAQVGCDRERLANDIFSVEPGVLQQSARRRLRVRPPGTHGDQSQLGLDDVTHARYDQRGLAVGHRQHRLEAPQYPVGAPVFCELDGRAQQISLVLVELRLEALEQRERVRGAPGESGEYPVVMEAPHLACARFHHDVAERDLAIAAQSDLSVATRRYDRGSVEVFHVWIRVKMEAVEPRIKLLSRNDTR